jgi:cytochrome c
MLKKATLLAAFGAVALSAPSYAQDAAKGEKEFNKCKSCHMIVAADGTEIVKGGKTGPNLWGVVGRAPGTYPDFAYGDSIKALGATGMIWDAALIAEYTKDPAKFLKDKLGDKAAKSKMSFKLAKGNEDVAAYLAQFAAPAPAN